MRRDILQKAAKMCSGAGDEEAFLEAVRWALAEVQKQDQEAGLEPKVAEPDEWDPKFTARNQKLLEAFPEGFKVKPYLKGSGFPEVCYAPLRPSTQASVPFAPRPPAQPKINNQEDHGPPPNTDPSAVLAAIKREHANVPKGV